MLNKKYCYLSFFLLILFGSCTKNECSQGEPTAIFNAEIPQVERHSFTLAEDKISAEEYLLLQSGEELEIWQRGCHNLRQEYRFTVTEKLTAEQKNDRYFWLATLLKRLNSLAKLGASYTIYAEYIQALAQQADNWTLGETQELGPGFYAKVDVVSSQNSNILMLILSDQP